MNPDDEEDFDPIEEDCGDSSVLDSDEARSSVRRYNQVLEEKFMFKKIISRSDPRSILHGL